VGPIVFRRARRYAERFRRFVVRHPDKLAELYHFGFQLVLGGKFVERFADREDLIVITGAAISSSARGSGFSLTPSEQRGREPLQPGEIAASIWAEKSICPLKGF